MFQPLWMFIDQQEEAQQDFFDLCEPDMSTISSGLESQTGKEEEDVEKV
jgi:hypothetical protein